MKISNIKAYTYDKRLLIALFLHSLSIISFQVTLMRILSLIQWDHFANMIISIAMMGFGISGTILALGRQRIIKFSEKLIPLLMLLSSFFMIISYRVSQIEALQFDTLLVFGSLDQALRLVLFLILILIPFLCAALAIGIIYVRYVSGIGKLYFSNLLGSGIGGIIGLILLFYFLPENALVFIAMFPAIASGFVIQKKHIKPYYFLYPLLILLIIFSFLRPLPPSLSEYKDISKTMLLPDAETTVVKSGVSSHVEIVESNYLRYAPGLSLNFVGEVPVKPMAFVNGNAVGFIPDYNEHQTKDILDHTTYKLPYIFGDFNNVAVIESGTGSLVAQALRKGAQKVYAIEPEISLINALLSHKNSKETNVYNCDKVDLQQIGARAFFSNVNKEFDLIVLPTIGSFGGGGLQAISENFTITSQALQNYWNSLSDNGLIAITVFTDFPPRATLKILNSFANLLSNQGVEDKYKHIAAIRSWTSISFVISKNEIDEASFKDINTFCRKMGFDPFILPGISLEDRTFYNYIEETDLFEISDIILNPELKQKVSDVFKDYLFYIDYPTDNKPYFSRFIKISNIKDLLNEYGIQELPFIEPGYIIVWLTFLITIVFSFILIIIPVAWFRKSKGKMPVLVYFGAIGLGFMFAEIILIQRFVMYLGQPVYAVTAVLSIMLLASGTGSYYSSKVKLDSQKLYIIYLIIFFILLFYSIFLTDILRLTAGYNLPSRALVSFIIVGLPAFFMGMPFPLGLKALSKQSDSNKIAWAWSVNGFFSVIATPLALIIAIEAGSFLVMGIAAIAYILALFSIYSIRIKS